jgi:hypothetical protein
MVAVLDDLGLTSLVTTIAGLTPADAAAILAETGDPARFTSPWSLVKHAGPVPLRQRLRRLPGQGLDLRARAARPAAGCLAGSLGRAAEQPGDGRPVHVPDHPPGQPARPPAGPHRLRRSPAALDPRRHHLAGHLGSRHRRRDHSAAAGRINTAH